MASSTPTNPIGRQSTESPSSSRVYVHCGCTRRCVLADLRRLCLCANLKQVWCSSTSKLCIKGCLESAVHLFLLFHHPCSSTISSIIPVKPYSSVSNCPHQATTPSHHHAIPTHPHSVCYSIMLIDRSHSKHQSRLRRNTPHSLPS